MTISTDKLIEALENFSMEFETFDYNQSDWVERDELSFARKILIQGLMDKVYFLTAGNKAKGKDDSNIKMQQEHTKVVSLTSMNYVKLRPMQKLHRLRTMC